MTQFESLVNPSNGRFAKTMNLAPEGHLFDQFSQATQTGQGQSGMQNQGVQQNEADHHKANAKSCFVIHGAF